MARRAIVLSLLLALCAVLSGPAARATVTTLSGYGFAFSTIRGQDDLLQVDFGCGAVCPPGAAAAGDGTAAGHAAITFTPYQDPSGPSLSVDVTITGMKVEGTTYPRLVTARGVGSDRQCWGISILLDTATDAYLGVAQAPLTTVTGPNGSCAQIQRAPAVADFTLTTL
ncbi:MAG: hypothetical protein ABR548_02615 [Actinomycetota bacterium]|nr:hypothetical protein [Actinomycetota bacterium]